MYFDRYPGGFCSEGLLAFRFFLRCHFLRCWPPLRKIVATNINIGKPNFATDRCGRKTHAIVTCRNNFLLPRVILPAKPFTCSYPAVTLFPPFYTVYFQIHLLWISWDKSSSNFSNQYVLNRRKALYVCYSPAFNDQIWPETLSKIQKTKKLHYMRQ